MACNSRHKIYKQNKCVCAARLGSTGLDSIGVLGNRLGLCAKIYKLKAPKSGPVLIVCYGTYLFVM
jgi:hypothetical protein